MYYDDDNMGHVTKDEGAITYIAEPLLGSSTQPPTTQTPLWYSTETCCPPTSYPSWPRPPLPGTQPLTATPDHKVRNKGDRHNIHKDGCYYTTKNHASKFQIVKKMGN